MSYRPVVLSLYRRMMRSSHRFHDYNFRTYAARRVREGFRENLSVEEERIPSLIQQAQKDAEMLDRQSIINAMYGGEDSVVPQFARGERVA